MSAHTPTPWVIDPAYPSEVQTALNETICSAWDEHADGARLTITGVLPCSLEESAANAAFIVRAVNAFEANEALIKELVEALKGLVDANDDVQLALCDGPDEPDWRPSELPAAQRRVNAAEVVARAALAKAGAR